MNNIYIPILITLLYIGVMEYRDRTRVRDLFIDVDIVGMIIMAVGGTITIISWGWWIYSFFSG